MDTAPTTTAPYWQIPSLATEQRLVGGVAAGAAHELGVSPVVIRTSFLVLTAAGGWGVVLYGLLWGTFALAGRDSDELTARPAKGRDERIRHVAVALFVLGLLLLIRALGLGFIDSLVWPCAVLGLGFNIVWHRERDTAMTPAELLSGGIATRKWTIVRIGAGLVMAAGGVTAALLLNFDVEAARDVSLAAMVVIAGLGLLIGPWIWRLVNDLTEERRRRIRSEERSDLAAHLHDSVLQTLSLIQRNSDDRATMVNLARRQERELRQWLYGEQGFSGTQLQTALETMAADVEDLHGVPIEVVVVGDTEVDDDVDALLRATREAATNAARHSGAARVDVYAEVAGDSIDVYVRDTGAGFVLDEIAEDRRGLVDSIIGRMQRRGGSATVHTEPGAGTEIELHLPRPEETT